MYKSTYQDLEGGQDVHDDPQEVKCCCIFGRYNGLLGIIWAWVIWTVTMILGMAWGAQRGDNVVYIDAVIILGNIYVIVHLCKAK